MQHVREALSQYWGYSSFLPLQEEAIESVLAGRDSVVVLPTGGGKSICFQAPAVVMPGTAVVVSPLISLMKDQIDALTECGVSAARIDSSLNGAERTDTWRLLRKGELKLLYVSPERLFTPGFLDMLRDMAVSFVAVDEAHCVSMWGHDFRPEYRQLGALKEALPGVAIHAYTATATQQVRDDIALQLGLEEPAVLVGSFDRHNLTYRVERRKPGLDQVLEVINRHRGESGIVYCLRRADVDGMAEDLKMLGYRVRPYHAGMSPEDRKSSQDAFIREQADIIVATVAFGMGIDKSNVRFVVHASMPKSLEHYQQESGRAGRDGLPAECPMFYSGAEYGFWINTFNEQPPEQQEIAKGKLARMYQYCTGITCRHKAILRYFGQDLDKDNCNACDVCLNEVRGMADSLLVARKILSCVARLRGRFGADYTAGVLTGSKEQRLLAAGHHRLSTYGLLTEHTKNTVRGWIEQLVAQDCLARSGEFNVIGLTPKGVRVMKGEQPRPDEEGHTPPGQTSAGANAPGAVRLAEPPPRKKERAARAERRAAAFAFDPESDGLFESLRLLRRRVADRRNAPAYVVFSDACLRDMAARRPETEEEFLEVSGVGAKKLAQYGDLFLSAIRQHKEENKVDVDGLASKFGY